MSRPHTTGRAWVRFANAKVKAFEDELLRSVACARQVGATWEQIGEVLGISAQAAHSRFAAKVEQLLDAGYKAEDVARW